VLPSVSAGEHIVKNTEMWKQTGDLKSPRHAPLGHVVRTQRGAICAIENNFPVRWCHAAAQHVEEGGLASPIGTNQTNNLAGLDFKIDLIDRYQTAKVTGKLLGLQQGDKAGHISFHERGSANEARH